MIRLQDLPRVTAPGGAYPYGNIKDDTGVGDGTPINVETMADIFQFFARMFNQSGLSSNGLPDNQTNGFQYYLAMLQAMTNDQYQILQTPTYAGSYIDDSTRPLRYRKMMSTIRVEGKINQASPIGVSTVQTIFTLPSGSRPPYKISRLAVIISSGAHIPVEISSAGVVTIRGDQVTFTTDDVYIYLDFDTV